MMLNHTFRSLRPGGHLVVVDRAPRSTAAEHSHEIALAVEGELRQDGSEIVSQDDYFIERPGDNVWWMVIGRKR